MSLYADGSNPFGWPALMSCENTVDCVYKKIIFCVSSKSNILNPHPVGTHLWLLNFSIFYEQPDYMSILVIQAVKTPDSIFSLHSK